MATYKINYKQLQEMSKFFAREKMMIQEEKTKDTIKHRIKDFIISEVGFQNIVEELPFDDVKEKQYANRTNQLISLDDLNTKTSEESFEFIGVIGNDVLRVEMTNTLTYYRDEVNSIVEGAITNYGSKDYSDSEYEIVDDPQKVAPSTKLLEIMKKLLRGYDKQELPESDDKDDDEEEEDLDDKLLYGSKHGTRAIHEKEVSYLKEVDKRIKKGQYEQASKILNKLTKLQESNEDNSQ